MILGKVSKKFSQRVYFFVEDVNSEYFSIKIIKKSIFYPYQSCKQKRRAGPIFPPYRPKFGNHHTSPGAYLEITI